MTVPRILIVGAGPTGLTAAVELARHGILAQVIERHATPSNLSRAVGLIPSSMAIFHASGVADDIRKHAITIDRVIFHINQTAAATLRLDVLPNPVHRLFGLPQDKTESLLRDCFSQYGGAVRFGQALETLEQSTDTVTATINGIRETFDYVLGCDGTHSATRAALGLAYDGIDLPEDWSIADIEAANWPDPTAFKGFLLPQGQICIAVPLGPNRFRIIGNVPDALHTIPLKMDITKIRRTGTFKISVRQVAQYQQGRVFLAGDAAHCHSPVGGRGMNLGISDAADLAARIADGDTSGYHAARHKAGAKVLKLSEGGRRLLSSPNPVAKFTVRSVLRAADAIPAFNRFLVRNLLDV